MKRIFLTLSLTLYCLLVCAIDYNKEFAKVGFIDIQQLDSTKVVDLKYSSTDNFMGINMYGNLHKAYLHPEIAEYDAARPLSAQKSMFDKVKGTKYQRYVANPYNGGGHHNFGCAVDLTILYQGKPVDMGTDFDSFSTLSHIDNEDTNLKNGTLSKEAYNNRKLLRSIMKKVGFNTERCEWWHYDCYPIKYARQNFPLLDF